MTVLLLFACFVVLPAAIASLHGKSLLPRTSLRRHYGIGVPVIYRQEEIAACPAQNACDVRPSRYGEFYQFSIINYLRVVEVLSDGRVVAVARNNERLCFWPNDASFRRARLTERLIYRPRFPHV